jgi:hypothetical protein
MSGYTVGEIVIWLVLAATLGFALGWIVRELLLRTSRGSTDTPAVRPQVPAPDPVEPTVPAKKAPAKKAPAKKAAAKKTAAKKTAAKKAPAKKATAKKAPAKKSAAKKSAAKSVPPSAGTPDDT